MPAYKIIGTDTGEKLNAQVMTGMNGLVFILLLVVPLSLAADCNDDYSPCSCSMTSANVVYIDCVQVPLEAVRAAFNRSSYSSSYFYEITLVPPRDETIIPDDMFSGKPVNVIKLSCPNVGYPLRVHPTAFDSSANVTRRLAIYDCDLSAMDYAFLRNFNVALDNFELYNSTNIQSLQSLPSGLNGLTRLYVQDCQGFQAMSFFPLLPSLKWLYLYRDDLNDQAADLILTNASFPRVEILALDDNLLTRVPPSTLSDLPYVFSLSLDFNIIKSLPRGSLAFPRNPIGMTTRSVYLQFTTLETIEPGAFQGDYSGTSLTMNGNLLTRFESAVFQGVLEQMNSGTIYILDSPIDCDDHCHLAWLLRDNRQLMGHVAFGACANGTRFEYLDPNGFSDCP